VSKKIHLFIVDPQNSFCKVIDPALQQLVHDGELCVPGAWEDMTRVASFVHRFGKHLNDIHVTLDSHHLLHIANPLWFRDSNGNHPEPFTTMCLKNGSIIGSKTDANGKQSDIGEYVCFAPFIQKGTVKYLKALASTGRYSHCIWPPHCLIGTPGHNVAPQLMEALLDWAGRMCGFLNFITKGSNAFFEHFSAICAGVPDPNDPSTQLYMPLIRLLIEADEILFAGEPGSHTLAETVRDVANSFRDDSLIAKCGLLLDCMSPLPGFETHQERFINEMAGRGMRMTTTVEYLA